jgi:hypothetical protein
MVVDGDHAFANGGWHKAENSLSPSAVGSGGVCVDGGRARTCLCQVRLFSGCGCCNGRGQVVQIARLGLTGGCACYPR